MESSTDQDVSVLSRLIMIIATAFLLFVLIGVGMTIIQAREDNAVCAALVKERLYNSPAMCIDHITDERLRRTSYN